MENGRSSNGAHVMGSPDIIGFIDDHRFLNSVIGKLCYDPTAEEKCNVDDLLQIIKDIFDAISPVKKDGEPSKVTMDVPESISHLVKWITCQMACEVTRGKDLGERLLAIFLKLSSYRRTTQVVLVLSALALQYGEFWYISEVPSAQSTGLLKGLSSLKKKLISEENKKAAITHLNEVVNDLLELTTSLVGLYKLVNEHRGKHMPELTKACLTIPRWSCETIIAILAVGNYFARLIDVDYRFAASELGVLRSSVLNRKSAVLTAIQACWKQIARMEYQKYVKRVRAPVDIVDFMTTLLVVGSSSQDLIVTGPYDTPVKFESFRKKSVLLIVSDLNISMDDVTTLGSLLDDTKRFQMITEKDESKDCFFQYQTEKETLYELVWIPVVDTKPGNMEELQKFKSLMPWAFRVDPLKLNEWTATYLKEEWRFKRQTMLVVLDSLGWVENPDAMPMLRIWGVDAYPYTGTESTHLWREPCNWVQLVIKEPVVPRETLDAITTDYIMLYGGTAVTMSAVDVTSELGIPNLSVVRVENIVGFTIRLRSCLICKLQALQILKTETKPLSDDIVRGLCDAYTACQRGGFAIVTKGDGLKMLHVGHFDATRTLLNDQKYVRDPATRDANGNINFAEVFKKKNTNVQEPSGCLHVDIPDYTGLGDLRCPKSDCSRFMKYDLSFMCCHTD